MFGVSGCVKQIEEALNIVNFVGFSHTEFGEVRIVMRDNVPWFVAADMCRVLEIKNSRDALNKRIDEDEKDVVTIYTPGGNQTVNVINEYGLYRLTMTSRKKVAKKFQKWIVREVLPSIRKYGAYINVNHPDIRQLSKDVRNKLESAIGILVKCRIDELPAIAKAIKASDNEYIRNTCTVEDAVYKFITSRINKAVGLKSHERNATDTKTLLNLIRYETYAIEAILEGLYSNKSLQHIINLCGYKVEKKLGLFKYYENVAA